MIVRRGSKLMIIRVTIAVTVIFGGVCGAPVVATRTGTKVAASTKLRVVAMRSSDGFGFVYYPVRVVPKVCFSCR